MSATFVKTHFESWGRAHRTPQMLADVRFRDEIGTLEVPRDATVLGVGAGRSYGDSCLNSAGCLIRSTTLDRVIDFDPATGRVQAEPGLSLSDLLNLTVPRGWFTSTTPGTRFVTLGGAVANDVHGKNHHRNGSFGNSVQAIGLARPGEEPHQLLPGDPLFAATIGGLGLTGFITDVTLGLAPIESAFLEVERIPFSHVSEFFRIAEESENAFEHTVSWIDCTTRGDRLGRGVFQRANWARDGRLTGHQGKTSPALPVDFPQFALNPLSLKLFNSFYNWLQSRPPQRSTEHYSTFFYPLDGIGQWNRIYGGSGFYQYQCAIPEAQAEPAVREILSVISRSGMGSMLAVLKTLGKVPPVGMLSFPIEGATLALDFPNRGLRTLALFETLDRIVAEAGGRLYPAKDGRMPASMFQRSFPQWQEFRTFVDPAFSSDFWRRVTQ